MSDIPSGTPYCRNDQYSNIQHEINKLNFNYGIDTIHSPTKGFKDWFVDMSIESLADKVGSVAGAWLGRQIGVTVGFIAANPAIAIVGYVGGNKIGGLAGMVAASYVAWLVFVENQAENTSIHFPSNATIIDSVHYTYGDLHNIVLNELIHRNHSNSNILPLKSVEQIYDDILDIQHDLGLIDSLSHNPSYKNQMIDFCIRAKQKARLSINQRHPNEFYFYQLKNVAHDMGMPLSDLDNLMEISTLLSNTAIQIDSSQIIHYYHDFINLVDSDNSLSPSEKEEIKTIGSLSISSSIYWNE